MQHNQISRIARRLACAALLAPLLSGCGLLTPTTVTGSQPPPIVSVETAVPDPTATIVAPTTAPLTPTNVPAPTAEPLPIGLPDWQDPAWQGLAQGDFNSDGIADQVLYIPAAVTVQPGDTYVDAHMLNTGVIAEALLIVQPMGQETATLLRIDRQVITSDRPLLTFPAGDLPAAFLLALDPGSSYTVMLLPLTADGSLHGRLIGLNYYPDQGAFALAPTP